MVIEKREGTPVSEVVGFITLFRAILVKPQSNDDNLELK
jgi:hypothetical protein